MERRKIACSQQFADVLPPVVSPTEDGAAGRGGVCVARNVALEVPQDDGIRVVRDDDERGRVREDGGKERG